MEYTLAQKLQALRQIAQEKLQSILCAIPDSKKELIIEPDLIKPLELVCGATWLRTHGVAKICKFDATHTPAKRSLLVYMIRGDVATFDRVLHQIRTIVAHQPQHAAPELSDLKQFHIIAVPTLHGSMAPIAEEEGMAGFVQLHRFNWDFLQLDENVLSVEMPQLYREVFVRGDTALLTAVTQSMRVLQMVVGRPTLMLTYGAHAEHVMRLLLESSSSSSSSAPSSAAANEPATGDFGAMLVVDRDRDYASCLLTPVTYSGLLMDVFRGQAGTLSTDADTNRHRANQLAYLRVPATAANAASASPLSAAGGASGGPHHLRLNGTHDTIYREQRYRHFSEVVQLLGQQAKQMGGERSQLRDMQLDAMQQYVSEKLPQLAVQKRELSRHLALCECIVAELGAQFEGALAVQQCMLLNETRKQTLGRIEEQLAIDANRTQALRQIALMHVTCGLSHEEATAFVQNYLNAFGHDALPAFGRLADVGLFPSLDAVSKITQKLNTLNILKQTGFQVECGQLKLLPDAGGAAEEAARSAHATSAAATSGPEASPDANRPDGGATCPSYVFNGAYIPLIAQLANMLLTAGRFEDFASRSVHTDQLKLWCYGARSEAAAGGRHPAELVGDVRAGAVPELMPLRRRTVWLHVLGGVTMAEIAACDLVGRLTGGTVVVTSDRLAACDDLMEAVFCADGE